MWHLAAAAAARGSTTNSELCRCAGEDADLEGLLSETGCSQAVVVVAAEGVSDFLIGPTGL